MSAKIFKYVVSADASRQEDMHVTVDQSVQETWTSRIAADPRLKLDDVGDALLHALNEILCRATKYRQLTPCSVSLQNNRTVVVAVSRDYTYYSVIHCSSNTFEIEDLDFKLTELSTAYYKSEQAISDIHELLLNNLRTSMTDMSGGGRYRSVDVIKMIVKQLKGFEDFKKEQAGALTHSTVRALRQICDESAGANSQLCEKNDKSLGYVYIRTNPVTIQKFEVLSNAGKLTNAKLSCLSWMQLRLTTDWNNCSCQNVSGRN